MTLKELNQKFLTPTRKKTIEATKGEKEIYCYGLAGSAQAMLIAALEKLHGTKGGILVAGDSEDEAGYIYYDLCAILGESRVAFLPSAYRRDIKYGQIDAPNEILRTETISRINAMMETEEEKTTENGAGRKKKGSDEETGLRVVVTYPAALAERVASKVKIDESTMKLKVGEEIDMEELQQWLREKGFSEVDYVYEPGQFAVRGSIVDIYSYAYALPYRIDFFGDEIDSIRAFNIETQLSEEKVDDIRIISDMSANRKDDANISLLDYIGEDWTLALSNENLTVEKVRAIANTDFSAIAEQAGEGDSKAVDSVVDAERFAEKLKQFRRFHLLKGVEIDNRLKSCAIDYKSTPQGIYHKNFDLIADSFTKLIDEGYKIYILSDQEQQFERLKAIFADRGDKIDFTGVKGTVHEGFVDHATKTCVFTDHQIFDRFHKYALRSDKARSGKLALSLKELSQIEVGDYIVHTDHGVGKFAGLLRTNVNGHTQEMIKLVYQNNDIIFVSIHALHKLSKYRGKEGVPPKINRIGSGAWSRVKERTKSKLKDIARDLIKLYAARKEEKGFAYSPDTYLQHELEASFIYEDTPDQLTATQAVKADMESARPMDRLLCGDVGFGKTEIAVRAAFKAATDGKQTALLVPTTVLAHQHYHTFCERLKDFPVTVDYLSRARTAKETKDILQRLEEGKIDIIIGTHKLIGKSVKFKDLGLLVIDEEQKFGVSVKEKLKQMKTNVDTLTMSATPIPRTLQFSLMGARDLSSITTPPPNRYPIVTNVTALTDELLAEAINFEMSRGGQVFMINNRIEGLERLEAMIKRVVPDARVVTAHGQMAPEKLEKAIEDFSAHDYDVLLSTTILENGIDMPRVNTIMVNNAQNFGLSELHQLRGRVGRSNRKAFCYLLIPPEATLSDVARRRLSAIESFSDLGSGMRIAMQDLDIRGAGNLLGAEQSGFIADLGFETYQKILKEAVTEIRTEEFAGLEMEEGKESDENSFVTDCVVETDMELLLPASYVPQESERISLYRELDSIERELDLNAFKTRLEDRFGKIPKETAELMRIPRLRRLARSLGIEKVNLKQGTMYLYFVGDENKAYYQSPMFGRVLNYLQHNSRRTQLREKNGRRSMAISQVPNVETAVEILNEILALPAI